MWSFPWLVCYKGSSDTMRNLAKLISKRNEIDCVRVKMTCKELVIVELLRNYTFQKEELE